MTDSLSSISAKSEVRVPLQRRLHFNLEGTVFGQVAKKLVGLLRHGFSGIPASIVISNTDSDASQVTPLGIETRQQARFDLLIGKVNRDSSLSDSNLVTHDLANCSVELSWQLIEALEDAHALTLVRG